MSTKLKLLLLALAAVLVIGGLTAVLFPAGGTGFSVKVDLPPDAPPMSSGYVVFWLVVYLAVIVAIGVFIVRFGIWAVRRIFRRKPPHVADTFE